MSKEINKVTMDMLDKIERSIKQLALNIQGSLIAATPVDTGWARSNWVSSIGAPVNGTPGWNESIAGAVWTLVQGPIYIANNVPYIGRLNAGSSQQAPAGFVESVIASEVAKSNRSALK